MHGANTSLMFVRLASGTRQTRNGNLLPILQVSDITNLKRERF